MMKYMYIVSKNNTIHLFFNYSIVESGGNYLKLFNPIIMYLSMLHWRVKKCFWLVLCVYSRLQCTKVQSRAKYDGLLTNYYIMW